MRLHRSVQRIRSASGAVVRHMPLVVLTLSLVVNLLLASKLLRAQQAQAPGLRPGTELGSFTARSPRGEMVQVAYPTNVPTILYHFSPTCSWCERNWANIRALADQTKGRYRVVGVSTTAVSAAFIRDHEITFDVASMVSADVAREYRLGGTPQTIVVSADGRVLRDWPGAYVGLQSQELETYLGLRLPGLRRSVAPTGN